MLLISGSWKYTGSLRTCDRQQIKKGTDTPVTQSQANTFHASGIKKKTPHLDPHDVYHSFRISLMIIDDLSKIFLNIFCSYLIFRNLLFTWLYFCLYCYCIFVCCLGCWFYFVIKIIIGIRILAGHQTSCEMLTHCSTRICHRFANWVGQIDMYRTSRLITQVFSWI